MANFPYRSWRNAGTSAVVHGTHPPSPVGWEEVVMDIVTGKYETVDATESEVVEPAPLPPGYKQRSAVELELVNRVNEHAEKTRELVEELRRMETPKQGGTGYLLDMRWVSIATTNLQTGYMALRRAITQPGTF